MSVTANSTKRDTPNGIAVDVHVPQNQEPSNTATSQLQNALITLPAGLTLDPSATVGLEACTEAQFGAGTNNAITCPAKSVVGTAEISTPVLGAAHDRIDLCRPAFGERVHRVRGRGQCEPPVST